MEIVNVSDTSLGAPTLNPLLHLDQYSEIAFLCRVFSLLTLKDRLRLSSTCNHLRTFAQNHSNIIFKTVAVDQIPPPITTTTIATNPNKLSQDFKLQFDVLNNLSRASFVHHLWLRFHLQPARQFPSLQKYAAAVKDQQHAIAHGLASLPLENLKSLRIDVGESEFALPRGCALPWLPASVEQLEILGNNVSLTPEGMLAAGPFGNLKALRLEGNHLHLHNPNNSALPSCLTSLHLTGWTGHCIELYNLLTPCTALEALNLTYPQEDIDSSSNSSRGLSENSYARYTSQCLSQYNQQYSHLPREERRQKEEQYRGWADSLKHLTVRDPGTYNIPETLGRFPGLESLNLAALTTKTETLSNYRSGIDKREVLQSEEEEGMWVERNTDDDGDDDVPQSPLKKPKRQQADAGQGAKHSTEAQCFDTMPLEDEDDNSEEEDADSLESPSLVHLSHHLGSIHPFNSSSPSPPPTTTTAHTTAALCATAPNADVEIHMDTGVEEEQQQDEVIIEVEEPDGPWAILKESGWSRVVRAGGLKGLKALDISWRVTRVPPAVCDLPLQGLYVLGGSFVIKDTFGPQDSSSYTPRILPFFPPEMARLRHTLMWLAVDLEDAVYSTSIAHLDISQNEAIDPRHIDTTAASTSNSANTTNNEYYSHKSGCVLGQLIGLREIKLRAGHTTYQAQASKSQKLSPLSSSQTDPHPNGPCRSRTFTRHDIEARLRMKELVKVLKRLPELETVYCDDCDFIEIWGQCCCEGDRLQLVPRPGKCCYSRTNEEEGSITRVLRGGRKEERVVLKREESWNHWAGHTWVPWDQVE